MRLKRFNWLSDGAIPLCVALLRVLWLAPWLELLRQWVAPATHSPVLPLAVMLVYLTCSMAAARLAAGRMARLSLGRIALAVGGFVALLIALWWQFYRSPYGLFDPRWLTAMGAEMGGWVGSLPASLLALPALIYLWVQGILDGQQALDRDDTWHAFMFGFVALALCAIASFAMGNGIPAGMSHLVLLYFATGMAALALSSLETTRGYAANKGNGQIAVDRYWLVSVASVIVILLGAGLLLSVVLTPDVAARLLGWTSGLMDLLGKLLYYVIIAFAYVIFALLQPLIDFVKSQMTGQRQDQQVQTTDYGSQLEQLQKGTATVPPAVFDVMRWAGLAALILAIGLIFALALRRFQRRNTDSADETRESILTRSLLSRQLRDLLRNRLGRLRDQAAADVSPFLTLDGEAVTRRQIRQMYQAFLAAMTGRGRQRERGQTPAEYEQAVQDDVAQDSAALTALTDAYVEARYAKQAPERSRVEPVRQAWQRLQSLLSPPPK